MLAGSCKVIYTDRLKRVWKRKEWIVQCDQCGGLYRRKHTTLFFEQEYHFCSRGCQNRSKSDGVLRDKMSATNLKRFGVEHSIHTLKGKRNRAKVAKESFRKARRTMLERYGPDFDEKMAKRRQATMKERYGVEYYSQTEAWKTKVRETSLERWGTESPSQSAEVKQVMKETCLKRYGVESVFQVTAVKQKIRETIKHRWGVEHISQVDWVKRKKQETRKRNGSYGRSNIEDDFYQLLCEVFDVDDIERQAYVNGWAIDFYVKSLDTYIQFDGNYWHGYMLTEDADTPQSHVIRGTVHRDQKQNSWFAQEGLRLVRILESEFKRDPVAVMGIL